ncbi:MAG: phospholipase D-like domain-containing protein [Verrucomicrobiales bacterium]
MELILNETIYQRVIQREVPLARKWLWILTADIKDMHVERPGGRFGPFLEVLSGLVDSGVEVRLVHAKEPGPRFREDFDRFPGLRESDRFERILCPRMHMKIILIDGESAYIGSANLTGAWMGAKGVDRRNFEAGIFTRDPGTIGELMEFLDEFWTGGFCARCRYRDRCPDPIVWAASVRPCMAKPQGRNSPSCGA